MIGSLMMPTRTVKWIFRLKFFNLNRFLDQHKTDLALVKETLCTTKKGRRVELLRLGCLDGSPRHRVLLTARHHACESLASYALEGFMEAVLAEGEEGRLWRSAVECMVVPFVDKDGVEDGDQGKNRAPHDHNRDYGGASLHASVAALRERVPPWSQGRLRVALDLHCPYIRGDFNEQIYFVGSQDQENWQRVVKLAALLEHTQTGPLRFRVQDNLPFGTAWNTTTNFGGGKSFAAWAGELPGIRVASSIELPYANVKGREVNAESARAFGRDLARSILRQATAPE